MLRDLLVRDRLQTSNLGTVTLFSHHPALYFLFLTTGPNWAWTSDWIAGTNHNAGSALWPAWQRDLGAVARKCAHVQHAEAPCTTRHQAVRHCVSDVCTPPCTVQNLPFWAYFLQPRVVHSVLPHRKSLFVLSYLRQVMRALGAALNRARRALPLRVGL